MQQLELFDDREMKHKTKVRNFLKRVDLTGLRNYVASLSPDERKIISDIHEVTGISGNIWLCTLKYDGNGVIVTYESCFKNRQVSPKR